MNPKLKWKIYGWVCRLPAPVRAALLKAMSAAYGWLAGVRRFVAFHVVRRISPGSLFYGPPSGLCSSMLDWCRAHADSGAKFHRLSESTREYRTICPKTIDASIHPNFIGAGEALHPATWVGEIQDGRIMGPNGFVITSDDQVLGEVSIELSRSAERLSIFERFKLPRAQSFNGTVAVLAAASGDVYFHWMFEVLPRLALIRAAGLELAEIDRFVVNETSAAFAEETLKTFGIPPEKCLRAGAGFHLQARRLIVPSLPGAVGMMPPSSCVLLREAFLPSQWDPLESTCRHASLSIL